MADIFDRINNRLRGKVKRGIAGIWQDEHQLVAAAKKVRGEGFRKFEAISPFPLHGIDEAMGIPRSFIPYVTFTFGLMGCLFGLWFTWWTSAVDWPLVIGGKPFWSLPAFIPIIFELTILFSALSSVGTLLYVCGLPKVDPPVIDKDLTSHKFALFIPEDDVGFDADKIEKLFKECGAEEVKRSEF
ncbi:MAG: DUF3341 domain-containing protein [Bdellovibrio sp.]|nr:MAG: DUF3341 domain-containing protein [Bdellovibrio sp.]